MKKNTGHDVFETFGVVAQIQGAMTQAEQKAKKKIAAQYGGSYNSYKILDEIEQQPVKKTIK